MCCAYDGSAGCLWEFRCRPGKAAVRASCGMAHTRHNLTQQLCRGLRPSKQRTVGSMFRQLMPATLGTRAAELQSKTLTSSLSPSAALRQITKATACLMTRVGAGSALCGAHSCPLQPPVSGLWCRCRLRWPVRQPRLPSAIVLPPARHPAFPHSSCLCPSISSLWHHQGVHLQPHHHHS